MADEENGNCRGLRAGDEAGTCGRDAGDHLLVVGVAGTQELWQLQKGREEKLSEGQPKTGKTRCSRGQIPKGLPGDKGFIEDLKLPGLSLRAELLSSNSNIASTARNGDFCLSQPVLVRISRAFPKGD